MPQLPLLPTSLVGSYAQPDWLIDREKLAGRFPPRTRMKELWRVPEEYLEQAARHVIAHPADADEAKLFVGHSSSA